MYFYPFQNIKYIRLCADLLHFSLIPRNRICCFQLLKILSSLEGSVDQHYLVVEYLNLLRSDEKPLMRTAPALAVMLFICTRIWIDSQKLVISTNVLNTDFYSLEHTS